MLTRLWVTAAVTLIGLAGLTVGAQETAGEDPQAITARGVIEDLAETDDGDEVLTLKTEDDTFLMLVLEPTTEVWYGDTQASTDDLWEEIGAGVEVEYVVREGQKVLTKVRFPSDIEE